MAAVRGAEEVARIPEAPVVAVRGNCRTVGSGQTRFAWVGERPDLGGRSGQKWTGAAVVTSDQESVRTGLGCMPVDRTYSLVGVCTIASSGAQQSLGTAAGSRAETAELGIAPESWFEDIVDWRYW